MSSMIGKHVKISVFGESHGEVIGVVIDGLPAGEEISIDEVLSAMRRRAPGKNELTSKRVEDDVPEILSGIMNSTTTGAPLCMMIKNKDAKSSDYDDLKTILRPGHADYTSTVRYKGFNDLSGAGHLSGRLTAPMTFAGNICSQILSRRGIKINATIDSIAGFSNESDMHKAVELAKQQKNSVGGIIRCEVTGLSPGVGSPLFEGVSSVISYYMFGIPAVKGIEFGSGFESTKMLGSENNDEFFVEDGKILTRTNNHGGVLGGISSGMPIVFRVAIKPTPSIGVRQKTVDMQSKENVSLEIKGRHDPCIVLRTTVVVESVCAIAILNLMMDGDKF